MIEMAGGSKQPSVGSILDEITRVRRRAILYLLGNVVVLIYFVAVEPFVPAGPLLIPLGFFSVYAGDLPTFPLMVFLVVLTYNAWKNGARRTSLEKQLKELRELAEQPEVPVRALPADAFRSSGTPVPEDLHQSSVRWFSNLQRRRMWRWTQTSIVFLVAVAVAAFLLLVGFPSLLSPPWGSMVFTLIFTGGVFAVIFFSVGAWSWRKEALRIGLSDRGVVQDFPPSVKSPENHSILWTDVVSAKDFGTSDNAGVILTLRGGQDVSLWLDAASTEAVLSAFERNRSSEGRLALALPGGGSERQMPADESKRLSSEVPQSAWKPNSMRRSWMGLGLFFILLGVALILAFGSYAMDPKTADAGVYLVMPLMVGIVLFAGARSFPSAVAIASDGFHVRTGLREEALHFKDLVGISTTAFTTDCTLSSGRTLRLQSLGAREQRAIQEAYRDFQTNGLRETQEPTPQFPITWLTNRASTSAAIRFFLPLSIPFIATAILLLLYFLNPSQYRGFVSLIVLATLPAVLTIFTIRAYRRAPSEVGISERGIETRYPHHLQPAVALERLSWNEIERVGGPRGEPFLEGSLKPMETVDPERYLTFRTKSGVVYTLGPISPDIELEVLHHCPSSAGGKPINISVE
ncbi:MAG: hypothetical protein JRN35_10625 [Nitrososphaerota archaeon]|nr:hypothetical protein [Nitrososphaerota archaeon]